jgi:uncharacterized cupin superfamily protein
MEHDIISNPALIEFLTIPGLASIDLGELKPKPTSMAGEQMEAAKQLWASADDLMKIGIWECSEGRFSARRDTTSETCFILFGRGTLHGPNGSSREFQAGDMLVLPLGWHGEWTVKEHIRKIYILHSNSANSC